MTLYKHTYGNYEMDAPQEGRWQEHVNQQTRVLSDPVLFGLVELATMPASFNFRSLKTNSYTSCTGTYVHVIVWLRASCFD